MVFWTRFFQKFIYNGSEVDGFIKTNMTSYLSIVNYLQAPSIGV